MAKYTGLYGTELTPEEEAAGFLDISQAAGTPLHKIPEFDRYSYASRDYGALPSMYQLYLGGGFPEADTAEIPGAVDTLVDTGGGDGAQIPGATDTLVAPDPNWTGTTYTGPDFYDDEGNIISQDWTDATDFSQSQQQMDQATDDYMKDMTGGEPDGSITVENIGQGREFKMPDGTIINIDPLEEQMLQEELRNEIEGTDTFTPTLRTETYPDRPVFDITKTGDPTKTMLDVPTSDVGLAYTGEFDPDDVGTVYSSETVSEIDASTPDFRYQNQFMEDLRNLPSDIKTSLTESMDAGIADLGKVKDFLMEKGGRQVAENVIKIGNTTIDIYKTLKTGAISLIGKALTGVSGLGLLGMLPKDTPTDKFNREYELGGDLYQNIVTQSDDPDFERRLKGYAGEMISGKNIGGRDPFGKNTVSLAGDYQAYATKTYNELAAKAKRRVAEGKELGQFDKDRLEYYSKVTDYYSYTGEPDEDDVGTILSEGQKMTLEDIVKEQKAKNELAKITGDWGDLETATGLPPQNVLDEIAADEEATRAAEAVAVPDFVYESPTEQSDRGGNGGVGQQTSRDYADWGYDPFAQGGRVGYGLGSLRKKRY